MSSADADRRNVREDKSTAYYFIEGINEVGIEVLFCNMGTDHAPIIEALAERESNGETVPQVILCPHENTAAHMALGFAEQTGRGQAVLVHVDVGTANAANAMHNALRSRLPVMLFAGKAPYTSHNELLGSRDNYVNFIQETFDQGALVRPYTKWEWTLPSGAVVKDTLKRAHTIMEAAPAGPVYLMAHRETLTECWSETGARSHSSEARAAASGICADEALVDLIVDKLIAAERPILVCGYAGRSKAAARTIEELAGFAGVAVFAGFESCNISHEFPCFLGYSPNQGVREADCGLLVDVDVPWFPSEATPKADSFWAHVDIDTLKVSSPMWSFPANVRLQGDTGRILEQILAKLKSKATPEFEARAKQRVALLAAERSKWRADVAALAQDKGAADEIGVHYVLSELSKLLKSDDLIFNEGIRNAPAALAQIERSEPNTMFTSAGGGLGWSGGMALGAKLAKPDKMVVQIVGDGSFYFGVPSSNFAVAKKYSLPFLILLLDNTGWSAVKQATLRVYPDGVAKRSDKFQANLLDDVEFTKIGEAFGAYAEKVTNPEDVPAALARAVAEVRGGRTAIVHMRVKKI